MKYLIACLLLVSSVCASADESSYYCQINQILDLSDSGELTKYNGKTYASLIGSIFVINRESGEMTGPPFGTESYKSITILDKGSKVISFKSVALTNPPNLQIIYIQVNEWVSARHKPFWGTEGGKIFSGLCE